MRVSNGEVWQAREALPALLKEPWPVKTAYWLAKLSRKLGEQSALIDEVRVKLLRQYGEEGKQGQITMTPESPNWPAFAAAFNELMSVEVEIPIDQIVLPGDSGVKVTPQTLLALESFVEVVS